MAKKQHKQDQKKTIEAESPDMQSEVEQVEAELVDEDVFSDNSAALEQELEATRLKAEEYLQGWQRALADFSNYKKRVDRDQVQTQQNVTGAIVKRYLDILDDLERALKNRPQDAQGAAWAGGIELIYRKLVSVIENEGVVILNPEGEEFNPNLHEAITSEDSPQHESGQIIEVLQKGYMLGDRVLRPAMVRVAR